MEQNKGWNKNNQGSGNGNGGNGTFGSLISIFGEQSIMTNNSGIPEMKEIRKTITETLKQQGNAATGDDRRVIIPKMLDMTSSQSPHLPGVILYTVDGDQVYLMPVLFYKKDAAVDALETINLGNSQGAQTYNKFAESFITDEMRANVQAAFSVLDGKQISKSFIVSNYVIDVDMYSKQDEKNVELTASNVSNAVLTEWYAAIGNFTLMAIASTDPALLGTPWKDGHLFGKDDTAVARVDATSAPFFVEGRPSPANLQIKLATANKNNVYNQNFNNVRTVATTHLNVSLELLDPRMYMAMLQKNPMSGGMGMGPLVPVISLGKTIPGEQMHSNHNIMSTLLGMYNMLAANNPMFFSEAFRQLQQSSRGSIANMAQAAYRVSGRMPKNEHILTTKSIANQEIFMNFIQNYVTQKAVFVMDIPRFSESPSDAEIMWNILTGKGASTESNYYKAFLMMVDKLTNSEFTKIVAAGIKNDDKNVWRPGEPIMTQTPIIIPVGTGKGRAGWFSLEEIDQSFLRDPIYYGDNETAISQYLSLQSGHGGKDLRVRQYELKKTLEMLLGGNVSVAGWKSRWKFDDKFMNTYAKAFSGAGNVTVTSNNATHIWDAQVSNDYLSSILTAGIQNNGGGAQGIGGIFSTWMAG